MQTIALKTLSEREFASTDRHFYHVPEWLIKSCSEEFECSEDDVSLVENPEGEEIIHIAGEPKARLVYRG